MEAVADSGRDWSLAQSLAATGWSDMTRLAKGDPEMGAGILATNAPAIVASLRGLRDTLDGWISGWSDDAADPQLRERLELARSSLLDEPRG